MSGKFIVIEGSDGSGKGTQFALIADKLQQTGHNIALYDFPQYSQSSSYFAKEYLNGQYGDADTLGAYGPSLFFSLDRFQASRSIAKDLAEGKVVLSNRFTGSNMAHQGQKIHDPAERSRYYQWLHEIEFTHLKIPKPDLNVVLIVPAIHAQKLVDKKGSLNYTDKERDVHEADIGHLERAVGAYEALCEQFPLEFIRIDCYENNKILAIPEVTRRIWSRIEQQIP